MNTLTRAENLAKFKEQVANGKILVGVGAGTGITAKSSEAGGADMLIIYNSGRYRMAGRGSLAGLLSYGDANQIVVEMGAEVLPVVKHTPVLAGVCGTDPFRVMEIYLKQLKAQGFNGVQNFPTVGLIDGVFRQNLEETGMGYGLEVEMIRKAHELDMLTCPYVFDPDQARAMAEAGADMSNVVKTTVLLADIADFAAMNAVYAEFFTAPYPARAAFQAACLPKNALVEIECVAVK